MIIVNLEVVTSGKKPFEDIGGTFHNLTSGEICFPSIDAFGSCHDNSISNYSQLNLIPILHIDVLLPTTFDISLVPLTQFIEPGRQLVHPNEKLEL